MTGKTNIGGGKEKITNAQDIEVVAADQIRIGDTVYVVDHAPQDLYADGGTTVLSSGVNTAAFSPDGKTLILGGDFSGRAKVYSVSGTTITYVRDIYANTGTTALSSTVSTATFSPDGKTLVLGGSFTGKAKVYSVSGTTITYVRDIYADTGTTALSDNVGTAAFSPDGKTLVLSGWFTGRAKVYSASGTTITYVRDIYADSGTTVLSSYVLTATFSPDGKTLVLGGEFTGYAKVYSVSGTTITYVRDIYADTGTTALGGNVKTAAFSPDGKTLVLGGRFTGEAKVYSVSGTTITYVRNIYADTGTTALISDVRTVAFSPDGKALVLGGIFTGYAKVYSVSGTTITYVRDIYADTGTTNLNSYVNTAAFSPDGKTLVLGGSFTGRAKRYIMTSNSDFVNVGYEGDIYANSGTTTLSSYASTAAFSPDGKILVLGGIFDGRAKVYSVSGTTITYVRDIYADTGTTALNNLVNTAAFSPDGKVLILGGNFTRYAKVYSVSGTTITYVRDIYADAGTTILSNNVTAAAFSPDGKTLILGGGFTGRAKVYSVSGTAITYVRDIYADTETTALDSTVYTVAFSPDSKTLVLGGNFTDKAKVYSVSGITITYVQDIYADTGTTVLSDGVKTAAFSPDGKTLVLGGSFTGKAKVYSVSGTTITYVRDIYADTGATALSNMVRTDVFSPDGKAIVLGGGSTSGAKVYSRSIPSIPADQFLAYEANQGIARLATVDDILIGYSKKNINRNETGKVRTIARLQNESWTGGLSFTGTYANATYFTESGCSLDVEKESGRAFLTIQGGTSSGYENILFSLASAPDGVKMLTTQQYTHASNNVGNYYTCVLTGVDRRINVFVDLNAVNATYDSVTASITVK